MALTFWLDYLVLSKPHDVQIFSAPTASQPPLDIYTVEFGRYALDVIIVGQSRLLALLQGLFTPVGEIETDATIDFLVTSDTSDNDVCFYSLSAGTFAMKVCLGAFQVPPMAAYSSGRQWALHGSDLWGPT